MADGVVKVDSQMMTGHAGIFAGGDMVPADRSGDYGCWPWQEGGALCGRVSTRH